jgi:hypothetical protein
MVSSSTIRGFSSDLSSVRGWRRAAPFVRGPPRPGRLLATAFDFVVLAADRARARLFVRPAGLRASFERRAPRVDFLAFLARLAAVRFLRLGLMGFSLCFASAARLFDSLILSCRALGNHLAHDFKHVLRVTRYFHRLKYIPDDALLVNDKGGPFCVTGWIAQNTECRADRTVGIGEKGRFYPFGLRELAVRLNGVARYTDKFGTERGEVS